MRQSQPGKHNAGWQMEFLGFSLYFGGRERERNGGNDRLATRRVSTLCLCVYINIYKFVLLIHQILVFVVVIGRPFGIWIFKKKRHLGLSHHESLRSWKQVLHFTSSPISSD